ncbi:hypothetical protein NQ315_009499 [Exocentrus adspersus]|uniref:Uncharacterized protein n=1 Tax=Exocentrus adspersus TaxID=1586481 RepID=A0AAV8WGG5_9CUCU|nr:hypothetical protein NQ315_009499 [Exocentrus adspersus]
MEFPTLDVKGMALIVPLRTCHFCNSSLLTSEEIFTYTCTIGLRGFYSPENLDVQQGSGSASSNFFCGWHLYSTDFITDLFESQLGKSRMAYLLLFAIMFIFDIKTPDHLKV